MCASFINAIRKGDRPMLRPLVIVSIASLTLSGCTVLEPNAVRIYGEHVSHVSQHFETQPTNYGYEAISVELHYQRKGWFADIAEGVQLGARDTHVHGADSYGGMLGPRELFTARAGYEFQLRN